MSNTLQNKLTHDQITVICQHGFGSGVKLTSVQPLEGGTFNETYLVELDGKPRMVLRVAPATTADVYWDDVALMRREYHVLPFFASIAELMPRVMLADFTHQIVDRDYMFQTFIEGKRWSDVEVTLSAEENNNLWRQCGSIVRRIHDTTGEHFGYPYPGPQFKSCPCQSVSLLRISRRNMIQSANGSPHQARSTSNTPVILGLSVSWLINRLNVHRSPCSREGVRISSSNEV